MSSSLAVLPNPMDRERRVAELEDELVQTREALRQERLKNTQSTQALQGVVELRRALSPLYQALRRVFEEMNVEGVVEVTPAVDDRKRAVWEAWKMRMPGITARIIDALLLHGSLTQTQLRIHAQCARSSVPNAVMALNRAGLINKDAGGRISLKQL